MFMDLHARKWSYPSVPLLMIPRFTNRTSDVVTQKTASSSNKGYSIRLRVPKEGKKKYL